MRIYFDNAATTPLAPEVIEVMTKVMVETFGNPSSIHREGRNARVLVEQARKLVAQELKASIGEIFFTSGGSEATNMALKGAVRDLGVERIISSPLEHHCVLHSLEALQRDEQMEKIWVQVDKAGRPDLEHLEKLLSSSGKKTLVSLMHANNEIGTMINLGEVSAICRQYGALFHSDTVQTVGYYPIDLSTTKIDFISGSAHKFHGPKGAGFIYIHSANPIHPLIDGGSQERKMRAGTENLIGIAGLAKALELAGCRRESWQWHMGALKRALKQKLQDAVPGITFNGDVDNGHYKILSASFPSSPKSELLLLNLDVEGVSVSGGSACTSGADAGSHVLDALDKGSDRKTIRFSFAHFNTLLEVEEVVTKLLKILN